MSSGPRVIVSGLIAQYPMGGVVWDYVQYAAGLAALGCDVYYLEDTGTWPYNPVEGGVSKSCDYNLAVLKHALDHFGLGERWAYFFPETRTWHGLSDAKRREVLATADLLINVSGTLARPQDYRSVRRLAYIDSDPVFTQVKLARGETQLARLIEQHDVLFSFGETLPGAAPATPYRWHATRQPIVLEAWAGAAEHRDTFTTVMNWTIGKPLIHDGRSYGHKDFEFARFMDLPERIRPIEIELAVNVGKGRHTPYDLLRRKGWRLADPDVVCPGLESYRRYVQGSKAEWSVAKHGYVAGRAGWFSCRSACYLAAGRPVVVEDTGFGAVIPTGRGILAFRDPDEAVEAIFAVDADYATQARAAREIAAEYFDAGKVLGRLLDQALAA